jgi:hypothetical protein
VNRRFGGTSVHIRSTQRHIPEDKRSSSLIEGAIEKTLFRADCRYFKMNYTLLFWETDLHSGCTVYAMNRFRPLEGWDRGFESQSRHGSLSVFILFV